jgi:hypothetical protein
MMLATRKMVVPSVAKKRRNSYDDNPPTRPPPVGKRCGRISCPDSSAEMMDQRQYDTNVNR